MQTPRQSMSFIIGSSELRFAKVKLLKSTAYFNVRYHDENTTEEDLTHPEDIEHFRQHDEMEAEAERIAEMDRLSIVEKNIPQKFLRS
jgi:hypothetical protein